MIYFVLVFSLFIPSLSFADSGIVLSIGSKAEFSIRKSDKIFLENSTLVSIKDKGNSLELIGKKLGETKLFINKKPLKVFVLRKPIYEEYQVLNESISQLLGLKLKIQNGNLFIYGSLHRVSDWERLSKLHLKNYKFKAKIDEDIQKKSTLFISDFLSKNFVQVSKFTLKSGLNVYTNKKAPEKNLITTVKKLGGSLITTKNLINLRPQLKIDIIIAEISKSLSHTLGIEHSGNINAQILPHFLNQSLFNSRLIASESSGEGQILARPTLLCKSGESASFLAGGEIPIKVLKQDNHSVVWKKYGVHLEVRPIVDQLNRIDLKLKTEISTIDTAISVDGVPGIKTNKVTSHFNFLKPTTILISGFLKENKGSSSQGLPFLSRIPILGKLFSSQSFLNNRTELVIFVKTAIHNNSAGGSNDFSASANK